MTDSKPKKTITAEERNHWRTLALRCVELIALSRVSGGALSQSDFDEMVERLRIGFEEWPIGKPGPVNYAKVMHDDIWLRWEQKAKKNIAEGVPLPSTGQPTKNRNHWYAEMYAALTDVNLAALHEDVRLEMIDTLSNRVRGSIRRAKARRYG